MSETDGGYRDMSVHQRQSVLKRVYFCNGLGINERNTGRNLVEKVWIKVNKMEAKL